MNDQTVDLPNASILIDPLWWPHQCSTESPDVCFLLDFLHIGCKKRRGLEGEGQVKAGGGLLNEMMKKTWRGEDGERLVQVT